jgi:putative hemolysin
LGRPPLPWLKRPAPEALALAQHPWVLEQEVACLPREQLLAEGGGLQCWVAEASQIPQVLEEIGVQRERCFRAAGEGTGKPLDLDRFDAWYQHLFLWNPERRELAGAYRMGLSDQILKRHGPAGLYTTTLFRLSQPLLARLSPGLEMGRSFVREGYQGTHGPLMLLWRGIGRFLCQRPRYRHLFGAVSISVLYRPLSRALMADFCRHHLELKGQGPIAKARLARRPFAPMLSASARGASEMLKDMDDLDEAVSLIEGGRCGVPVLLKHYSRIGGRFAGFNLDPAFNNAVDGLVVVDLLKTPGRVLARYMGSEEARAFHEHHGVPSPARQGPEQLQ